MKKKALKLKFREDKKKQFMQSDQINPAIRQEGRNKSNDYKRMQYNRGQQKPEKKRVKSRYNQHQMMKDDLSTEGSRDGDEKTGKIMRKVDESSADFKKRAMHEMKNKQKVAGKAMVEQK